MQKKLKFFLCCCLFFVSRLLLHWHFQHDNDDSSQRDFKVWHRKKASDSCYDSVFFVCATNNQIPCFHEKISRFCRWSTAEISQRIHFHCQLRMLSKIETRNIYDKRRRRGHGSVVRKLWLSGFVTRVAELSTLRKEMTALIFCGEWNEA